MGDGCMGNCAFGGASVGGVRTPVGGNESMSDMRGEWKTLPFAEVGLLSAVAG